MSNFKCPYCSSVMAINNSTFHSTKQYFFGSWSYASGHTDSPPDDCIHIKFYKCPHCREVSIRIDGEGNSTKHLSSWFKPNSIAQQFPDYIPEAIRSDYEEACAIVSLSPKASATLSRRCLQAMIRDFWGIADKTLYKEISVLQSKVSPSQWKVLDALRKIGNIGAHPEADVNLIIDIDPSDAEKLIKVIELLIQQWYINRHEEEQLYADVLSISDQKQQQRQP